MSMTPQPEGLVRKRRARMDSAGATDEFDIFAVPPLVESGRVRIGHTYRTENKRWQPVSAHSGPLADAGYKTHNEAMAALGNVWAAAGKPGVPPTGTPADTPTEPLSEPAAPKDPQPDTGSAVPAAPTTSEPEAAPSSAPAVSTEPEVVLLVTAEEGPEPVPASEPAPPEPDAAPAPQERQYEDIPAYEGIPAPVAHQEVSKFAETEHVHAVPVPEGHEFPPGWQHPRTQAPVIPPAPPQSQHLEPDDRWAVPGPPATDPFFTDPFGDFTQDDRNPVK